MNWSTVEQLIRIISFALGGFLLGEGVTDGEMFQSAIGGVIAVGAFGWWLIFERNRVAESPPR